MENLIEDGRTRLREQEALRQSLKDVFTATIDILRENGSTNGRILRYTRVEHTVNSATPVIPVEMAAGANLDKARKVGIYIRGVGALEVSRVGSKGSERYKGKEYREDKYYSNDLDGRTYPSFDTNRVQGYLSAVRQVQGELRSPRHS